MAVSILIYKEIPSEISTTAIDGNNSEFQYLDDFATRILLPIEGLASDLRSGRIPDAWLSIWKAFRGSHAKNILFHTKNLNFCYMFLPNR